MSERYPGGIITKNPATPTGPYESGAAPGIWTLDQQLQYKQQGVWPIAGNVPPYIEDVFSTYLYTGTGGTAQSINNGIDLVGKGGLVWIKSRSNAYAGGLQDTARGASFQLIPSQTAAQYNNTTNGFTSFNSNGFSLQNDYTFDGSCNNTGSTYASWTFREQPKFFDVVTYTGSGAGLQTIAHNLGSVPGCIITKLVSGGNTSGVGGWGVYHRSTGASQVLELNSTAAAAADNWYTTTPTATNFYVFGNDPHSNRSGGTYVAYLFAHDAGGFGLTGTDNVISCGSYTTDASAVGSVTLGWEPQWVLLKCSSQPSAWFLMDNMRGFVAPGSSGIQTRLLFPNTSASETNSSYLKVNATGFVDEGQIVASGTVIYIAIRRGPMKVPTDATKVFIPVTATPSGATTVTTNFPVDLVIDAVRNRALSETLVFDRLRGGTTTSYRYLNTSSIATEQTGATYGVGFDSNVSIIDNFLNPAGGVNTPCIWWNFRRAPSFFDEVCYTGTGGDQNITHNLGVAPELMIIKSRSTAANWPVFAPLFGDPNSVVFLNLTNDITSAFGGMSQPTSSSFLVRGYGTIGSSGITYVAYLFATCPGVSKVGSYTGTGATQTINCGFGASGSRFVLIKRTDAAGDWYVWDSARGMISGTDPSLLLNSTAAEVNANSVYAISTGFQIVSTAAGINASAGTYIFLSVA